MPLGATVDTLRGISGFDGAHTAPAALALAAWSTLGLSLLAVAAVRRRPTSMDASEVPVPAQGAEGA